MGPSAKRYTAPAAAVPLRRGFMLLHASTCSSLLLLGTCEDDHTICVAVHPPVRDVGC